MSDGIVSGFREDSKGRSWLQTTAPASHGNSGGPLLTMDGKVAGIVTWKATDDGEYIYSQWVNLPPALQSTTAFARSELKKNGDKWVGKSVAYLPGKNGLSTKWCRIETEIEITAVSDSRIEGRSQGWETFKIKNCEPEHLVWKQFVWIPK